ncbi:MAG: methyltransferase [Candidatus Devosia symbiotica]|nr:methyltransferase [Candidatus Devosia symbiotica]
MSLDQPAAFVKHETVTRDAFLGGRLTVSQPRHGFRAGLDSVLLGAAVSPGRSNLLDMGCGVGTAAFVALTHAPAMQAVLVDQNLEMLMLAARNIADNSLDQRARVLALDICAKGSERQAAGLADNAFDVVIANPPFFADGSGTLAGDVGRAGSRHMGAAALDHWVKTAAGCAAAGGEIIFVYPAENLTSLLSAFEQRFGAITLLPLTPRPGGAASRVLLRAIKGSRAPLTLLASRSLHDVQERGFNPAFDAIFRGSAWLYW